MIGGIGRVDRRQLFVKFFVEGDYESAYVMTRGFTGQDWAEVTRRLLG